MEYGNAAALAVVSLPPSCAVGAPGAMAATRFARRCFSGAVRTVKASACNADLEVACISPDRAANAAGGAPVSRFNTVR